MNAAEVRVQIEEEITWRRNELRFLANISLALDEEDDQARFRKALIVMLYSHFEGFCKAALTIYVRAINQASLKCSEASEPLVAASLSALFDDLGGSRKSDLFRRELPDDASLHKFARQVEFVIRFPGVLDNHVVLIPEDIVDPESNLKPAVLKKNLFRLGFDPALFSEHDGAINQLLRRRNDVAHGVQIRGIEAADFMPLQQTVFGIMDGIAALVSAAIEKGLFRRAAGVSASGAQP
jgi:hypothetical protein